MAKITATATLQNAADLTQLRRFVSKFFNDVLIQFNGNVQFGTNILSSGPFTVTFTAPNVATAVNHNLGLAPQGYLIIQSSAAMNIYKSPGQGSGIDWTPSVIYLNSSAAGTAQIYVI